MFRPSEAYTFLAGIKDGVVAVEKIEAKDPVANVGGIHEAQLTLACWVLDEGGPWELVGYVVYFEGDVFELDVVISATDRCR